MKGEFSNEKKVLCLLTLVGAMFLLTPSPLVSAKESDNDYTIVDMQTGEEEKIDLDSEQYQDVEEFVSRPSFPNNSMSNTIISKGFSEPGIGTSSIIGNDDRTKVTNTNQFPYTAIARMTVEYQDGTAACRSGAMISGRVLATAGHVLINSKGSHPKKITMQFGQNGSYVYYETSDFSSYVYKGGYETDRSVEGDYGFVIFKDKKVSSITGHMGIITSPSTSERLYTAGYPGDKGYYYMYAATGNILRMNDDLIYHKMDTMGGQSGSPVYVNGVGGPYIVAMHSSGMTTQNIARRLDPALYQWMKDNGFMN